MSLKSLNGRCATVTGYRLFKYSPGVKLPRPSNQSHLPEKILLICKGGARKAAQCSAPLPRRGSPRNLSLSSFFTPMSRGAFSPCPHSAQFSSHGTVPAAFQPPLYQILAMCHVYLIVREALYSIRRSMGLGACLLIWEQRAEIAGKELL